MQSAEFSRQIEVSHIHRAVEYDITATQEERQALAARFDLIAIESLQAKITLRRPRQDSTIQVTGSLTATVLRPRPCTLETVSQTIKDEFNDFFVPDASDKHDLNFFEYAKTIDIGEVTAQYLLLNLTPRLN